MTTNTNTSDDSKEDTAAGRVNGTSEFVETRYGVEAITREESERHQIQLTLELWQFEVALDLHIDQAVDLKNDLREEIARAGDMD